MLRRTAGFTQAAAAAADSTLRKKVEKGSKKGDGQRNPATKAEEVQRAMKPLLGYPIRRAAAAEMLYGGVRTNYLSQKPFPLHYTRSEDLPPPSLDRERHDLQLEMQLPQDGQLGYNNISQHVQRQLGHEDPSATATSEKGGEGSNPHARPEFHLGNYFNDLFHPERHHTSSLPYATHDTNNVLGLRLFPLNLHVRYRVEGVRIRTEDLLERVRDEQLCAANGLPCQYPLPLHVKARLAEQLREARKKDETLYSRTKDASVSLAHTHNGGGDVNGESTTRHTDNVTERQRRAHLRGGPCHPPPEQLSIFTRPQDLAADDGAAVPEIHATANEKDNTRAKALQYFYNRACAAEGTSRAVSNGDGGKGLSMCASPIRRGHPQYWQPLQMLKPMGHAWSASMRSSGARGPSMQLMQERLDQKGFGWKRKSRSLWQQDIDTAGFRPHRYF